MSKPFSRPALSLPSAPGSPTPHPRFPTPWGIGPGGDIWVAADVALVDGAWTHTTGDHLPRHVVSILEAEAEAAKMIVEAVNAYYGAGVAKPPY